jgi:predicted permease
LQPIIRDFAGIGKHRERIPLERMLRKHVDYAVTEIHGQVSIIIENVTPWNDFRFAVRQLSKSRVFTFTVLMTLALCLGANTAIYTVVDHLFLRPLPYRDPARLVLVAQVFEKGGVSDIDTSQTGRVWELVRDHATFLESAVYAQSSGVNLVTSGHAEFVQQQRVSANFFHVLGVAPLLGREFRWEEDVAGGPPLAMLSYALWQRDFAGKPEIIGKTINLRGAPYSVIAVLPPGFRTDQAADLYTPLRPSTTGEGGGDNYGVIARLKAGVSFAEANGQLASVTRPAIEDMRLSPGLTMRIEAIPLQSGLTSDLRPKIRLMSGAVALVLLIGCVNIAGILLARSGLRSREIATRLALGGSRARIIRQLLAEAILLGLGGGLLGLVFGRLALTMLVRLNPQEFEAWGPVQLDFRVMAVMLAVSLGTGILFGLFPAWEATALELRAALTEGGRGASGSRRQWQRQALVFAEVALGVVLVASAGLLIRTLSTLLNANPGFNPRHVLTASLSLQDARYQTAEACDRLFRDSLARIRELPGVEAAAVALTTPYQRPLNVGVQQVAGRAVTRESNITNFTYATPGMFEALQVPLLRGRVFTAADDTHAPKVTVVNQAFVARYLQGVAEPLGTPIKVDGDVFQIIGVVATVQQKNGWGAQWGPIDAFAQVYVPASQVSGSGLMLMHTWFSPSWIVRTRGVSNDAPAGLPQAMSRALHSVDPDLPFSGFHTMTQIRNDSLGQQRYLATLFSVLAGLAMLLASLGVYGLVAQSVAQRTREMGIRLALGATTRNLIHSAAGPGLALALSGVGAGLLLSIFATRLLKKLLWGVTTGDPLTLLSVALLMLASAGLASVLPALKLSRLDPVQTLRNE